jgi:NAD(P)-dependent dehydrogenase (short-subunit alcohol dehydrogenase family)
MNLNLNGQTAVVFGGASGIGLAIARAFAGEACKVAIVDRSPASEGLATELAAEFSVAGTGIVADVTDYPAVQNAASEIEAKLPGDLHIIYAAGMGSGKFGFPFWNLQPSDWEQVWRVNMLGAVNVAHAFGPRLAEARRGTLLFISSVAGQIGSQTDPPYSAAKAALINFAQVVAKDLAPHKVRVNTICPGMIQTPLNRRVWQAWHDQQSPEQRRSYEDWGGEKVGKLIPLGRWQDAGDIASLAVFLASDQAKNITGQTHNVDGGWVMHS